MSSALARPSQNMIRQALASASRKLSSQQVTGEAGHGLVRATLAGDGRLVDLNVNASIGKEGPKAIEHLVAAAVNRAHQKLREETRRQVVKQLPPNVDPAMVLRALP